MKWLLIIGVLVGVLFATGVIHVEFYSTTEPAPAGASGAAGQVSAAVDAPPEPPSLGSGVRSAAVARWLRRMNVLCGRRNRLENAIPGPDETTLGLARYAARTVWVWNEYERQAAASRAPRSYAAEAGWLQQADAAKGASIQNVLDAARMGDRDASHAAISSFATLDKATYRTYVRIGLTACGRFAP
jgi:hypothetical protein